MIRKVLALVFLAVGCSSTPAPKSADDTVRHQMSIAQLCNASGKFIEDTQPIVEHEVAQKTENSPDLFQKYTGWAKWQYDVICESSEMDHLVFEGGSPADWANGYTHVCTGINKMMSESRPYEELFEDQRQLLVDEYNQNCVKKMAQLGN